jgi:hypothetical protein
MPTLVRHARWSCHGDSLCSVTLAPEGGTCHCMVSARQGETLVEGIVNDMTGKSLTMRARPGARNEEKGS